MKNRKLCLKGVLLFLTVLFIIGCGNKNRDSYGYWSGVDNRDAVTYDIHITKDYIIMLEDKGATKYKYNLEDFAGRDTMAISGKELAKHIEGMDDDTNSFVNVTLINDDKDNPFITMLINIEGTLSDAQLYPVDKKDSPLSDVEGSKGSFLPILFLIGLFIYLFQRKKGNS